MTVDVVSFHVVPVAGQWDIKRNGSPVATFLHKEHAMSRAREMARRAAPSQLVVYTYSRSVEEESTFGEMVGARTG
ncbi:MAG TPA: DUF2188 domain-containing protein [Mycobacteriales bacterium]|jgi:hypothetical protein|nr:DUF2188 domain-containing protein [Mycobacteriales bacterium]